MLYLVLILILAAFGLLIVALVTGTTVFAWVSLAASATAAAMLVVDWARRRRHGDIDDVAVGTHVERTGDRQQEDAGEDASPEGVASPQAIDGDDGDRVDAMGRTSADGSADPRGVTETTDDDTDKTRTPHARVAPRDGCCSGGAPNQACPGSVT